MITQYYAVHRNDAEWMIGEQVRDCKHAFTFSGYDLGGMVDIAAPRGLVIVKATGDLHRADGIEPVIERIL